MARQLSDAVKNWSQGRNLAAKLARTTVTHVPIADGGAEHTLRWRAWFVGYRVWDCLLNYEGRSESEIRDAAKKIDEIIALDNESLQQDGIGPLNLNNIQESGDLQMESEWIGEVHDLNGVDPLALTDDDPFPKLLDQFGLCDWQRWEISHLLSLRMIDDAIRHHISGKNDLAETLLVKALDETHLTAIVAHGKHRNTEHLFVRHNRKFDELEKRFWLKDAKSQAARKAANELHRENHAMRDQVIKYYVEHEKEFSSMDAAAEAIVTREKLVPVKFRTVRDWIGQHRKQLRSARKA